MFCTHHPVEPDDVFAVGVVLRLVGALPDAAQGKDVIPGTPVAGNAPDDRCSGSLGLVTVGNGDTPEVGNLANDPTHRLHENEINQHQ